MSSFRSRTGNNWLTLNMAGCEVEYPTKWSMAADRSTRISSEQGEWTYRTDESGYSHGAGILLAVCISWQDGSMELNLPLPVLLAFCTRNINMHVVEDSRVARRYGNTDYQPRRLAILSCLMCLHSLLYLNRVDYRDRLYTSTALLASQPAICATFSALLKRSTFRSR